LCTLFAQHFHPFGTRCHFHLSGTRCHYLFGFLPPLSAFASDPLLAAQNMLR
jgi:hypothetical protein